MIFIELSKLTPVIPCSEEPISLQILKISLMRSNHLFIYDKELLRKKSSETSVKANATMPIGIMGSDSLVFLYWRRQCFKKEKHKYTGFGLSPSAMMKCLSIQSNNCWSPLPRTPFGIVAYSLFGQPFLKQLYILYQWIRTCMSDQKPSAKDHRYKVKLTYWAAVFQIFYNLLPFFPFCDI